MGEACSSHRRVTKLEEKRPFGSLVSRRKDNTKEDLKIVKCKVMDWIHQTHNRDQLLGLVNTVMNFRVL